jgi:hypothetical protein
MDFVQIKTFALNKFLVCPIHKILIPECCIHFC